MSNILRYLGSETKNDYWTKSSIFFDKCGQVISKISDIIIEYLSGKEDNIDLLPGMFTEVLNNMIDGYKILDI